MYISCNQGLSCASMFLFASRYISVDVMPQWRRFLLARSITLTSSWLTLELASTRRCSRWESSGPHSHINTQTHTTTSCGVCAPWWKMDSQNDEEDVDAFIFTLCRQEWPCIKSSPRIRITSGLSWVWWCRFERAFIIHTFTILRCFRWSENNTSGVCCLLFRPSQHKTRSWLRPCSCLWLSAWWRKWLRRRRSKQKQRWVMRVRVVIFHFCVFMDSDKFKHLNSVWEVLLLTADQILMDRFVHIEQRLRVAPGRTLSHFINVNV